MSDIQQQHSVQVYAPRSASVDGALQQQFLRQTASPSVDPLAILLAILAPLLKVHSDEIDVDLPLLELGCDSQVFAQLIQSLQQQWHWTEAAQQVGSGQTLQQLAEALGAAVDTAAVDTAAVGTAAVDSGTTVVNHCAEAVLSEAEQRRNSAIEQGLADLLWAQIQQLPLDFQHLSLADISRQLQLPDRYQRWFAQTLSELCRRGHLREVGKAVYRSAEPQVGQADAAWQRWREQRNEWLADPNSKAQIELVEATLQALPQILQGTQVATDIMFPKGSMARVQGIYQNNPVADYFNRVLCDVVEAYVQQRLADDADAKIRLLEIGAGTGGTSAMLFERLRPYASHIEEYCYTDISKAFLLYAEQHYGADNPYLSYRLLDVSQPLAAQQPAQAGDCYDLVLATNVLHATGNMSETLRNGKALLHRHGLLLANEISNWSLFAHLTFGLLEGWWLYEDPALRIPGSPGLAPDAWRDLLLQEGFNSAWFAAEANHDLGQQIVVAESNGVVRQLQVAKPVQTELVQTTAEREVAQAATSGGDQRQRLKQPATEFFRQLVSTVLKIPLPEVEPSVSLEEYGIDSILVSQLNAELEQSFSDISSTLFFEYHTIDALVAHFIDTRADELAQVLGVSLHDVDAAVVPMAAAVAPVSNGARFMAETTSAAVSAPSTTSLTRGQRTPIAIIGLSGRYPLADDLAAFWQNLVAGRDCIREVPSERWPLANFYNPDPNQALKQLQSYSKWGGFIDDFANFDAAFFSISPREAVNMDPQERLFIETSWAALEDAGYSLEQIEAQYDGQVGVFVGVTREGYNLFLPDLWRQGEPMFPHTSFSSMANRISYLFNFKGPSLPMDSMCSSSLTAIHHACEQLHLHNCEMALAGGVNLYLHPTSYVSLCVQRMLSEDGQCKSFGAGGNGFVPGEGVGAVLLKRLDQAERDGDQIHAVIRGSSINHGGKTSGYTVPNPAAQAAVVRQALDRAGVSAADISFIEAHGTGTELGDPIEIKGLQRAFEPDTQAQQFCAIGSAKSNIGHLEAAAGIAGLTKVILQMRHQTLVPSLHAATLNPNIPFERTPFQVQREVAPWSVQSEAEGRLAGISSFGAGGVNAHLVVQEYSERRLPCDYSGAVLTVLSARSEAALRRQLQRLGTWLADTDMGTDEEAQRLVDMAYTLQVGREPMPWRLALVVDSVDQLQGQIDELLSQSSWQPGQLLAGVYFSQLKRGAASSDLFADDDDAKLLLQTWLQKRKLNKLADLWVKGTRLPWSQLYGAQTPRRISLPTYAFEPQHLYIPLPAEPLPQLPQGNLQQDRALQADSGTNGVNPFSALNPLHPLLQQNRSTFAGQCFTSRFDGSEFFFDQHRVQGQPVLPGVAQLEWVRAAIQQSLPELAVGDWRLQHVVWAQPLAVTDAPLLMELKLEPQAERQIHFQVLDQRGTLYSEGQVLMGVGRPVADTVDIDGLRQRLAVSEVDKARLYQAFAANGLQYGPSFQGLEQLWRSDQQVLARLQMPAEAVQSEDFVWHPGLLDAALQATVGLATADQPGTYLPFALDQLHAVAELPKQLWAVIAYSAGCQPGDAVQKLDVTLCDEQGQVCLVLSGFTSRLLAASSMAETDEAELATLILDADWQPLAAVAEQSAVAVWQQQQVFCTLDTVDTQALQATSPGNCHWHSIQASGVDPAAVYTEQALNLLQALQTLLCKPLSGPTLLQLLVVEGALQRGLFALLHTAQAEHPALRVQLLEWPADQVTNDADLLALTDAQWALHPYQRRQQGQRYYRGWREQALLPLGENGTDEPKPWRDGGGYLISGGCGGLGAALAREIATSVSAPRLYLLGRSPLDERIEQQLHDLQLLGAEVSYTALDVADAAALAPVIEQISHTGSGLQGVLHCAGQLRDGYLLQKQADDVRAVFAAKVAAVEVLDQLTAELPLDLFVLFSSAAALFGNPGQGDYGAANGYLDAFAQRRQHQQQQGLRHGRSVSINWPLWRHGGMGMSEANEQLLRQRSGMQALADADGLAALYRALQLPQAQLLVMSGEVGKLRQRLRASNVLEAVAEVDQSVAIASTTSTDTAESPALLQATQQLLQQTLAETIHMSAPAIDVQAPLADYGVDSVVAMQVTGELEQIVGSLPKTLFFEYQTVAELAAYLVQQFTRPLGQHLAPQASDVSVDLPSHAKPFSEPHAVLPTLSKGADWLTGLSQAANAPVRVASRATQADHADFPVAVIGLAGRYPNANDIDTFWQNLCAGDDAIEEIPSQRWSLAGFYHDDRSRLDQSYCKWGGFIDGVEQFDPLFFQMSPQEAAVVDPQARLFLETCWQLFERAGYTRAQLKQQHQSQVGVFVGSMYYHYTHWAPDALTSAATASLSYSAIANRVSHFFDLQGPSVAVDTMCSSALVALHQALQSLRQGECQMAVAGAVNLSLHPKKYLGLSLAQLASSDPERRSFSAGDGYLPAEGVGAVLLKPLAQAQADGDIIAAVIRGTAINHTGRSGGYMVPSVTAQAQLLQDNFARTGIDPASISYVEAAAVGSSLGDPIELAALNKVFGGDAQSPCALGSVKSNIGHAEAASGMSQLSKVILQLQHRQLVPSIKAEPVNPDLPLAAGPFQIQQQLSDWPQPQGGQPRRATVSSFGAGGSNVHVIVEEYVEASAPATATRQLIETETLVLLSARDLQALRGNMQQLLAYCQHQPPTEVENSTLLIDIAYTLQIAREAMPVRLALPVSSLSQLQQRLQQCLQLDWQPGIEMPVADGIHAANLDLAPASMQNLFANPAAQQMIDGLIQQRALAQLALCWCQGANIDWQALYPASSQPRRMVLPTYAFTRQRCWLVESNEVHSNLLNSDSDEPQQAVSTIAADENRDWLAIVAELLGLSAEQCRPQQQLSDLGLDSISRVLLLQQLQARYGLTVSVAALQSCQTLAALAEQLALAARTVDVDKRADSAELIKLNSSEQGAPIFWIHGGLGGVEAYVPLAQTLPRPFYGIQARGWMTDEVPIEGIEALAEHYVGLVESIQPQGPVELGGFSLGGVIAYEMTRQLQLRGRAVASLVMLDAIPSSHLRQPQLDPKTPMLQAMNTALFANNGWQLDGLINRQQLDSQLPEDEFWQQLQQLASAQGLHKDADQLRHQVQQSVRVQSAYRAEDYQPQPLPQPQPLQALYIRNGSGDLFGQLAPYFLLAEDQMDCEPGYQSVWLELLPQMRCCDVPSSNHFMMLAETTPFEQIADLCQSLYQDVELLPVETEESLADVVESL